MLILIPTCYLFFVLYKIDKSFMLVIYYKQDSFTKLYLNCISKLQFCNKISFCTIIFQKLNYSKINMLNVFLHNLNKLFNCKLYFKKRGFWVFFRVNWPNILMWNIKKAHPFYLESKPLTTRRYRRYARYSSYLCLDYDYYKLLKFINVICKVFPLNRYTRRGIKYTRIALALRVKQPGQYDKLKGALHD